MRLEKTVFMVQGENTTVVQYKLLEGNRSSRSASLEVRPLIAFRDYHSTTHENNALNSTLEIAGGQISIKPYSDLPKLHFAYDKAEIDRDAFWYRNFQYRIEQERGLDSAEDLFSPFGLSFDLSVNPTARIIASTERVDITEAEDRLQAELQRRQPKDTSVLALLKGAADQFIVSRGAGKTVIAGYHWFSDWGRDTMIAPIQVR